jgi:putative DNA primase/helicase
MKSKSERNYDFRGFNPRPYASELLKKHKNGIKFERLKEKGRWWVYDREKNIWATSGAKGILEAELRLNGLTKQDRKIHCVNEVLADLKVMTPKLEEVIEPPWRLIPFNDCYFDLTTGKSHSYSPDEFFISKLKVNYNPKATCPTIDRIFSQLVRPKELVDLYEAIAYCFVRSYPGAKIMVLYGVGDNGKSVYMTITKNTLGFHNVDSVSLYNLQHDRFKVAELHGKFANFSSETDPGDLDRKSSIVKQLTGGDLVQAERKFRDPFRFVNYAKLFWSMNRLPPTRDKSRAFYRRIQLIEFPYVFEGRGRDDRTIIDKIPEREYEGLAFKCVNILKRLANEDNFHFTNETSAEETEQTYERLSDPIGTFIEENCIQDDESHIQKGEFKNRFKGWVKENRQLCGYKINDARIKEAMKERSFFDGRPVTGKDEDGNLLRARAWEGVGWRTT